MWARGQDAPLAEATGPVPRVLIVEDSPDHQALIRRTLERAGIECDAVGTGEEALGRLDDVDIVLIDQGLPRMTGIELLQTVSSLPDGPAAVLVTAYDSPEVLLGALRGGAIDFVAKDPTYLTRLPAVVQRAFLHHDVRRRSHELERLALLVHQPIAREDTLAEIVVGARRLLRATGCLLAARDANGAWSVSAVAGAVEPLAARLDDGHDDPSRWRLPDRVLAISLPTRSDEPQGVLLVERAKPFLEEEAALGRTFAAFAASALRHARQHELERGLIDELQRTMRIRNDFVASVSHELRTPLTAIGGYAETLLERGEALGTAVGRDLLERIQSRAQHLEALIFQLLDVADLQRGAGLEPKLERVGLAAAMERIVGETRAQLEPREVALDVEDAVVMADPELMHRCVTSLVNNAAKFSPAGSPIEITAYVDGDAARISVHDHGVGIAAQDAARVFEPFWRAAHSVAQAIGGTGVGLALVRAYAEAMGGEVGVDSEPGVGSSFWFTLPLALD